MSTATLLLSLQDVDLKLMRIASTLEALPQRDIVAKADRATRRYRSELLKLTGQHKDIEMDIAELEERLAHYRDKTTEVQVLAAECTTHRELTDFERQLTSLAKQVEKCEFGLVPLRKQCDEVAAQKAQCEQVLAQLAAKRTEALASFEQEASELKGQYQTLTKEREELCSQLDEQLLETYQRASKRFGGLAVEQLQGNVPSICRVTLRPSQYHDVKQNAGITECPYCHRMLIIPEELS